MKNRLDLTRLAELDRQFCDFAKLQRGPTPRCGWTKTIRLALGMSSKALGARLGVTAQGVRKLEQAEEGGTITLNTLARLAHGLDCEVHYMFVPRTSLMQQVLQRTLEVSGSPMPPMLKVPEVLAEPETLDALTRALTQVNKRGLW
ncbi:helix-turn-helix domain-containing protein [Acidovorax sp. 1608163]|uniref:helix-turn-helix domain-containing protein n=1 Tax=Acidovorax sp. 1608163 TaxID=2478662 RepID=UPI000EF6B8D5|nr:helix-turn-helix domain-containing protein [Acidovorax sp. 1608163]AYM96412.1 helix-turn-helix domain-containing protein [Acidovorax sp. 1608163]